MQYGTFRCAQHLSLALGAYPGLSSSRSVQTLAIGDLRVIELLLSAFVSECNGQHDDDEDAMNEMQFLVESMEKFFESAFRRQFESDRDALLNRISEAAADGDVEVVLDLSDRLKRKSGPVQSAAVKSEARHWAEKIRQSIEDGTLRDQLDELRQEDDGMDIEPLLFRDFPRLVGSILYAEDSNFRDGLIELEEED